MKQSNAKPQTQPARFCKLTLASSIKPFALILCAALPLIASASTASAFGADALIVDAPLAGRFDWPRFSLLAAGVIALLRARAAANGADAASKPR